MITSASPKAPLVNATLLKKRIITRIGTDKDKHTGHFYFGKKRTFLFWLDTILLNPPPKIIKNLVGPDEQV
jgi:hypothetical protein